MSLRHLFGRPLLAVGIAIGVVLAIAWAVQAQIAQQPGQPYSDWAINELSRQMGSTNAQVEILRGAFASLDRRQSVTESQMSMIIWLLGATAIGVITQVVLAISNSLGRSKSREGAR